MNFFKINLEETIRAINYLTKKDGIITVEKIRQVNNIKSSNRSKVNFIWRALDHLVTKDALEYVNKNSPKIYKLTSSGKNYIDNFLRKEKN